MRVTLLPPQLALTAPRCSDQDTKPIPYTGSPFRLCISDIFLFIRNAFSIPAILRPIRSPPKTSLNELSPSTQNIFALALHGFLFLFEGLFLLSLPLTLVVSLWFAPVYVGVVWLVVWGVSSILNGKQTELKSDIELSSEEVQSHKHECWIFINGVTTGHHWLHSNVNRLSQLFRRPVLGLHNRTYGLLFDLLQCIVERCFCYATTDIRRSYATIRANLLNPAYTKVILIAHSQGGIETSLILDWLLIPHDIISKLEIYTFGSAANHFNNPPRHSIPPASPSTHNITAVRHIEHYAHSRDFVARWGCLTFVRLPNRYMGRVFIRPGTGHLLNQHYLNAMFPLGGDDRVLEHNDFMDMEVEVEGNGEGNEVYENAREGSWENMAGNRVDLLAGGAVARRDSFETLPGRERGMPTVRAFSRLWCYRNGGSPKD